MSKIIIYIILLFASSSLSATEDTTHIAKQKYPLNDSRNPDCPCHKYQKLAEKEYALMNKPKITEDKKNITEVLRPEPQLLETFIPQQIELPIPPLQSNTNITFAPQKLLIEKIDSSTYTTHYKRKSNNIIFKKIKHGRIRPRKNPHHLKKHIYIHDCYRWH